MKSKFSPERLEQANQILKLYSPKARFEYAGGMYFVWEGHEGKTTRLRWLPRSRGSDYPTISCRVPFGGTCTMATMELTRWARGLPVRPLSFWRGFVKRGGKPETLRLASEFGWPEQVPCVFCGQLLDDEIGWDHYDRKGFNVGPGCYYNRGCQVEKAGAA